MRYATVPRALLEQLIEISTPKAKKNTDIERPRTDERRTPAEDKLVAARSPLRSGPRWTFRRPMLYATGAPAPVHA
ncbi:hypothetical protein P3T36_006336 [Kitasatospora sp. MAP12-15]|uniref:hypothetical protein n=1 Tax=unclassified Kitasatospora TaxID=2633591 RepID=UPI002476EDA6|nr:hypothetical protein [Kitasatospora sp. MAP12-44]MDH6107877.1 hypothetical protein [Kitasatospora sp. MAP12-44]